MSIDRVVNAIKAEAANQASALGRARFGIVTNYKPGVAKVQLQPEGTLTGWLPVCSLAVGSGWGIHCPLKGGEQVLVLAQDGNAEHGVIVGRVFSDTMQPPGDAGDIVLVSSGGAKLLLGADGSVKLYDSAGDSIIMQSGTITLSSNNFVFNGHSFTVNASTGVTVQTPLMNVSNELDVGTGPIKQNGVTVVVP